MQHQPHVKPLALVADCGDESSQGDAALAHVQLLQNKSSQALANANNVAAVCMYMYRLHVICFL